MCGFAGFLDYRGQGDLSLAESMAESLFHRGPDDGGAEFIRCGETSVGLGFRRLAIIDLSAAGHQPMSDPTRMNWIMMNGEVYNYREIRQELERSGISFRSNSDTEVVLQAWLRWGPAALSRMIGMFAIAVLEPAKNTLTLIRDRAGVKPLFYHVHPNGMLFGSELKAFHRHPSFAKSVNPEGLGLYFRYGNIPAPHTIFKDTFKVSPGEFIQFDLNSGKRSAQTYWNVLDTVNQPLSDISYAEALQETTKLMESAFQYRMVADVPVGVFLSGGYDSTAVAALLSGSGKPLNTYTIGFDDASFDESAYAEKVARHLGTQHLTVRCTLSDAKDIIPELPKIYDEPFGDSSAVPTTLVSRVARQHVTVALSADAGDELFAGYPRHARAGRFLKRREQLPSFLRTGLRQLVQLIPQKQHSISSADRRSRLIQFLKAGGPVEAFDLLNQTFSRAEIAALIRNTTHFLGGAFEDDSLFNQKTELLNRVLATEYRTYLVDDILQKVDRASMSVSLEGREPFLDHRLAEWAMRLPVEFKLKDGVSKRILKDIVHTRVPRELMERPKMGFGVPVKHWMAADLKGLLLDVMGDQALKRQDLVDPKLVRQLREDYLGGRLQDFERLWFVFTLLQWNSAWMD
ncbi:MAG: asparagine synthase (glutamine-hydrolyzing) [Sphingobacteriales bacterium]|jgi:asparagine synthase (glutamine-hydrolysing)|nr:asparagine synthase (glutamine-hydrolyzing) [Sphingobacteriales bacterium]